MVLSSGTSLMSLDAFRASFCATKWCIQNKVRSNSVFRTNCSFDYTSGLMFLRRKQDQLNLQNLHAIYNDVCSNTVKNHELELRERYSEALKGWKSLHTTLLYQIDAYEKCNPRMSSEEADMIAELKAIRDENVRHLIRLLLIVEPNGPTKKAVLPQSSIPLNLHSLSVPSLRSGLFQERLLSGNNQRFTQRTFRSQKHPSAKSESQTAASLSWAAQQKQSPSIVLEHAPFEDFDQTEYCATKGTRHSPGELDSSSSDSVVSALIDLSDDTSLNDENKEDSGVYRGTGNIKNLRPATHAPLPPPPRASRGRSLDAIEKTQFQPQMGLRPSMTKLPSKSTSKLPTTPPESLTQNKEHSGKTKPIKSVKLSHDSKAKPDQRLSTAKTSTKSSAAKIVRASVKALPSASAQKSTLNIAYNYKVVAKPPGLAGQNPKVVRKKKTGPSPSSQTNALIGAGLKNDTSPNLSYHNGILDDYSEETDAIPATDRVQSVKDIDTSDLGTKEMSSQEQNALIKSIKGIDETAATQILNDILVHGDPVMWDDVVGLESAKANLIETVVYPFKRPELFRGLREPPRGLLLFGPPGTGKTMLARAVATGSSSTFFSISSSSLTSKYLGESEKLVKALFLLARKLSPSIIFIDEIDSILGQRTEGEADSMRRVKNEFLVLWSALSSAAAGRDSSDEDAKRVLILGATNMPWAIDEAARRRFAKRVYIPLPERETRKMQLRKLLELQNHTLLDADFESLTNMTEGFSGSDITLLAKDSAMGPLRDLGVKLLDTRTEDIRPIQLQDFVESLKYVRPSVSQEGLSEYEDWASKFGSSGA